jgi:PhnB protein
MKAINPYLNFNGTTEEAFNFYKSIFGGDFPMVMRFNQTPAGQNSSPEDGNKIMHMALPVGNGNMLMATDALESMGHKLIQGNNFFLCISPDSLEEGQQLFDRLSEGGKIAVPFEKQFWGSWHGNFTDKFGVQWMIDYGESNS